jgi:hypothetical protein
VYITGTATTAAAASVAMIVQLSPAMNMIAAPVNKISSEVPRSGW